MNGKVKWFDAAKGYGFIQTEQQNDVFVHFSGIAEELDPKGQSKFKTLQEGQEVTFDISEGKKGPNATNVRIKR